MSHKRISYVARMYGVCYTCMRRVTHACAVSHIKMSHVELRTGWQRCIGCLMLQVCFHKRATNYRTLLRKITYKDKASYASPRHCMRLVTDPHESYHTCAWVMSYICTSHVTHDFVMSRDFMQDEKKHWAYSKLNFHPNWFLYVWCKHCICCQSQTNVYTYIPKILRQQGSRENMYVFVVFRYCDNKTLGRKNNEQMHL